MARKKKTKVIALHRDKSEHFTDYTLEEINELSADFFVYWYESGSWDGRGFAIWKRDDKWFYDGLGHCSCYGPTENLKIANNAGFTFEQVSEIAKNDDYSGGKIVIEYIIKKKLNA